MGRTTIQVSEELADELHGRKSRGDSYEDVIWRLIDRVDDESTTTDDHNTAPSDPVESQPSPDQQRTSADLHEHADDDLVEALREYYDGRPPRKTHVTEAVIDVFELLREHGTLETKELKDALWETYGDRYSNVRTMWNSVDRHLEECPGVEKGGYGEWTYAGDGVVRDELEA